METFGLTPSYISSARPIVHCPLTGLLAPYRDPRTGVPYANSQAYKILTKVLAHEYIWSDGLGCYSRDGAPITSVDAMPATGPNKTSND